MKLEKYCPLVSIYSNKMLQNIISCSGKKGKWVRWMWYIKYIFVKAYKPIIDHLLYYSIFSHSIYQLLPYSKLFPVF